MSKKNSEGRFCLSYGKKLILIEKSNIEAMTQIIPLENKILIEPIDDTEKSIVRKAETEEKKRSQKGRVLAVGNTYEGILKKGDIVYFQKYNVEAIEVEGKEYLIGIPDDFYCKIVEKHNKSK